MLSFAKIMIIPIVFGALAAASAFLWQSYAKTSETITWVIGCAVFCVLMALWNYFRLSVQSRQISKKIEAIWGFEEDLLKRIREIEITGLTGDMQSEISDRLKILETAEAKRNNLSKETAPIDNLAGYEDEKVIMLQANRAFAERLPKDTSATKRAKSLMVSKSLSDHPIEIRLQPIVNLITKQIAAVEAIGYLHTPNGSQAVPGLIDAFSRDQLCNLDRDFVRQLARVARTMDRDGQSLPIYFTLHSIKVADHKTWPEITQMLMADAQLSRILHPQISLAAFNKLGSEKVGRFLELKEYGLKPCLSDCSGADEVLRIANLGRIDHYKMPVSELLKYTSKEGERVADVLLPKLQNLKIIPIASDISKAHEAANLIDLDITLGQGDFISPPRDINLNESSDKTPAEA